METVPPDAQHPRVYPRVIELQRADRDPATALINALVAFAERSERRDPARRETTAPLAVISGGIACPGARVTLALSALDLDELARRIREPRWP